MISPEQVPQTAWLAMRDQMREGIRNEATLIAAALNAWPDCYGVQVSTELKEAAARIERLEAALRGVMQEAERHHAENITRAELGGSDMAQRKAKAIVSRSGVLLHSIKGIARAALEEK